METVDTQKASLLTRLRKFNRVHIVQDTMESLHSKLVKSDQKEVVNEIGNTMNWMSSIIC